MRKIARNGLVFLVFHGVVVAMGCSEAPVENIDTGPRSEIVRAAVCPEGLMQHMQILDDGDFVVVCFDQTASTSESTVYRFDEDDRSTMIYTQTPGFTVEKIVGEVMYISRYGLASTPPGPVLRALRLDAGATTPSTVIGATLHEAVSFDVSKAYAYWGWSTSGSQTSDPKSYGISRVPLAGGTEEEVAAFPVYPGKLAVVGEDAYALGHSLYYANGDYNIAIAYVPAASHTAAIIFSEPSGALESPWFGAYQDHVIWSDTTAIPAKAYEIRGSSVQPDESLRCAPDARSVLSGDIMLSWDTRQCASPEKSALIAMNLATHKMSYFRIRITKIGILIGVRKGWIYAVNWNDLVRVRLESL